MARLALSVLLGLAGGLGVAEAVFRHRDGGAFPLVNVFERDELRGVRLSPGSATQVGRRGERVTHVRVNRDGYRGPEWPAPARDEVLIVGDSLSFGLGVEEDEALAARLHQASPATPVLDASVPTYGPPEYLITMEQTLARRSPKTVVVVLNLINDLAEIDRPNAGRHTAVDGWAARREAAGTIAPSPLRELLIQRSHAAFALWRWQRTREAAARDRAVESGLADLLRVAAGDDEARDRWDRGTRAIHERGTALAEARAELASSRAQVVALVQKHAFTSAYSGLGAREWGAYVRSAGEPEDQSFEVDYGGCGFFLREGPRPRTSVIPGTRIRDDVESTLREQMRLSSWTSPAWKQEVEEAFTRREAAASRLAELEAASPPPPPAPRPPLPIAPFLERARAIAAAHGARLVVLPVPIDAQIAGEARARRGIEEAEVASLDRLEAEVVEAARAAGAIGVDPTAALKQAGAAAFLPDGHLAAAGHEAAARAVAAALAGAG
jgi:hypothetical protein